MPPERQPAQKRRRLPFKPPSRASTSAGPSTSATTSKSKSKSTANTSTKKTTTKKTNATASSSKSNVRRKSPSPSQSVVSRSSVSTAGSTASRDSAPLEEPDYILAEITHNDQAEDVVFSEPVIPSKLLTRLLHHHFRNEKTKIAKDANAVVAKYIDVYVREAVARAAYERTEAGGGASGTADGFLEVEDLEKMGPQLAMDF